MTKIKICGLFRQEDAKFVNRFMPDYAGFVFYPPSKRNVSKDKAKEIKKLIDKKIKTVGVFVDSNIDFCVDLCKNGIIDVVQLHGNEDENYICALRQKTNALIIKAFKIKDENDIEMAEKSSADYILLDYGMGEGKSFDWNLLERINREYFLAGGLDCKNISKAVKVLKPFAVDVSSGVETNGVKDENKIKTFIETVRKDY